MDLLGHFFSNLGGCLRFRCDPEERLELLAIHAAQETIS